MVKHSGKGSGVLPASAPGQGCLRDPRLCVPWLTHLEVGQTISVLRGGDAHKVLGMTSGTQ